MIPTVRTLARKASLCVLGISRNRKACNRVVAVDGMAWAHGFFVDATGEEAPTAEGGSVTAGSATAGLSSLLVGVAFAAQFILAREA